MSSSNNLQEAFLARAVRSRMPVTMFLMNGYQMRGVIAGFDAFVVVLNTEGRQQVIYKHAISTIAPERPIDLGEERAQTESVAAAPPMSGTPAPGTAAGGWPRR